jgi:hypothetical protein
MEQEQITLTGRIKEAKYTEIITFALDLTKLDPTTQRLVFIVNVPEEGRSRAPVYVKQVAKEEEESV